MAIVYDKLMALKIPDAEHTYTVKDTMLYALGVGVGQDPFDRFGSSAPIDQRRPRCGAIRMVRGLGGVRNGWVHGPSSIAGEQLPAA